MDDLIDHLRDDDEDTVEVESRIKLDTGERERLIKALAVRKIMLSAPVSQRDVYFMERGFRDRVHGPGSTIVRVRYTPSETTLNMKRLTVRNGVWEECETTIQDGHVAERIMDAMGAEPAVVVRKARRSGHLGDIEIQLDEVEELGIYFEVALQVDEDGEVEQARKTIDHLLRELDFPPDRVELRGYPMILFEQQGVSFSTK